MNAVRKQVYISEELDRTLKEVCQDRKVSESDIIRQALEEFFRAHRHLGYDPILLTIGLAGGDGPRTGSIDHDDIYERAE